MHKKTNTIRLYELQFKHNTIQIKKILLHKKLGFCMKSCSVCFHPLFDKEHFLILYKNFKFHTQSTIFLHVLNVFVKIMFPF